MSQWDMKERPNRFPWPPILLAAAILFGFALGRLVDLTFAPSFLSRISGATLIGGALALDVWSSLTFRRAQTTILPHQGSNALVTTGPFAYSRNPIYVGNLMILLGVGLFFGTLWHLILVVPLMLSIQHLAIVREEQHLASRFPEDWAQYAAKVRRWI